MAERLFRPPVDVTDNHISLTPGGLLMEVSLAGSKEGMSTSTDKYWHVQLDEAASARRDQRSFHVFAEGQHSDVRGQIYNLADGGELTLPHDRWPKHLFVIIGIRGEVEALVEGKVFKLRAQSQLVVLPGTPCKIVAPAEGAVELISLLSMPPRVAG